MPCPARQKEYRLFANAASGTVGGWDNEGVDKLKWSGASALAINKATCRQDRAYTCFRRIRSGVIFIEN